MDMYMDRDMYMDMYRDMDFYCMFFLVIFSVGETFLIVW